MSDRPAWRERSFVAICRDTLYIAGLALAVTLSEAAPARAQSVSSASEANAYAAIDARFERWRESEHVPGLVWAVVREGRIAHLGAAGVQDLRSGRPVNADTVFRIASMSKAFTALAILQLRDSGRLSLDEPAETYVPELGAWRYPTADAPRVRVRDLLSHTAGFVTDDPWGDRQQPMREADFTALLREGVVFNRAPQTRFEYSNLGYAILGRVITNVSGRPFDQYIEAEIMRPLGMNATSYDFVAAPAARRAIGYRWEEGRFAQEPVMAHGAFGAMGGVTTSANDYARWAAFLLGAWPARDGAEAAPARRASVRELAQGVNFPRLIERRVRDGAEACEIATVYGMGMNVLTGCGLGLALGHSGGFPGYGSNVLLLPDHGVAIFAFANRTYAPAGQPVLEAALELERAGLLTARAVAVSASLADAYRIAGEIYRAGDIDAGRGGLAMNVLMDRSAANWRRELARLRDAVGQCETDTPIAAEGALAGHFVWQCERGRLTGSLLLAPTRSPLIQALRLETAGPSPDH